MNRPSLEKLGTTGAFLAAAACPICFPKIALVGALLGLGALAPLEGYFALAVQALFLVALAGQWVAFRRHRNRWLVAFATGITLLLFAGFYVVPSATLLQLAMVGLAVASVWLIVAMRRCAACAAVSPKYEGGGRQ